jgi:hypothetical protein
MVITTNDRSKPTTPNLTLLRTKNAADFQFAQGMLSCLKGTDRDNVCHKIWRHLQGPFVLPKSVCLHQGRIWMGNESMSIKLNVLPSESKLLLRASAAHCSSYTSSWEVYDFHLAGCMMCGAMHICVDCYCPVEKNDKGHEICTITGLCVKTVSFSNEEFVDTACCCACYDFAGSVLMMMDEEDVYPSLSSLLSNSEQKHTQLLSKRKFSCESELKRSVPNAVIGSVSCRYKRRRKEMLSPAACSSSSMVVTLPSACGLRHSSGRGGVTAAPTAGGNGIGVRCSVNKKNRYRSWVYHRVTRPLSQWCHSAAHQPAPQLTGSGTASGGCLQSHRQLLSTVVAASKQQQQETAAAASMMMKHCNNSHSTRSAVVSVRASVAGLASLPDPERIHCLIQTYVEDVLCSHKWKQSMLLEV